MTCEHCNKNVATVTFNDGYNVCRQCETRVRKYYYCDECDRLLPMTQAALLRKRHEVGLCGAPACQQATAIRNGWLCCEQAVPTLCVCTRSYACPVHGDTHIGSHD